MSTRFLHHSFDILIPCACCGGELQVHAEGHFNREEFALEICTNKHTGIELQPTDVQRDIIERRGDEQYQMVFAENLAHQRELRRELNHEIRYGI